MGEPIFGRAELLRRFAATSEDEQDGSLDDLTQPELDAWRAGEKKLYGDDASFSLEELAGKTLRGKNLACWCRPGEPCHAEVLLELANAERNPA